MTLDELKKTHWATLKKMVEEAGGQYEDKDKSIQFLVDAGLVTDSGEVAQDASSTADNEAPVENLPTLTITEAAPAAPKSKSNIKLDRSLPFGEIFGEIEGYPTARFSQGEHLFNSQGEKL